MIADSIILTIHNKDFLVKQVVKGIFDNTTTNSELIFVLDGCTDKSEQCVEEMIKICPSNIKPIICHTDNVYETRANNFGMKSHATGDYIIVVQDDQIIKNEPDWNLRLRKPCKLWEDVLAVSSRCAHNWTYNTNNRHEHIDDRDDSWCDILTHTEHKTKENTEREVFAIRDTVNRGPLLWRHEMLQKLNYLDESIILKQDMDEHDLHMRAFKQYGWKSGLLWLNIVSNANWGGTRQYSAEDVANMRAGLPAKWLLLSNHRNVKMVWNRHRDTILGPKHNEERILQ